MYLREKWSRVVRYGPLYLCKLLREMFSSASSASLSRNEELRPGSVKEMVYLLRSRTIKGYDFPCVALRRFIDIFSTAVYTYTNITFLRLFKGNRINIYKRWFVRVFRKYAAYTHSGTTIRKEK